MARPDDGEIGRALNDPENYLTVGMKADTRKVRTDLYPADFGSTFDTGPGLCLCVASRWWNGGLTKDLECLWYAIGPLTSELGICRVLTFGAAKYAGRNWEKGIAYSRVYGALRRHLLAIQAGEEDDPESGLPHADHAGCCAMFLLTYEIRGLGDKFDDRP